MNRLERIVLYVVVALAIGVIAGCMTPAQQTEEVERINRAYEAGRITFEQWQNMLEEVCAQGGVAWWQFILGLIGVGAGTYKAVQIKRGPPEPKEMRTARLKAAKAG